MGCQLYTSPGTDTWTWPDGVDRAVVYAQGGSGGGVNGLAGQGRGAGGGGAFAERLILKTDATATVVVGSGGTHAPTTAGNGVDSGVTQASSLTEKVTAAGGKGGDGPAGGAGGAVADSYGTIKYKGGDGASRNGDSGGGGGGTACATGAGDDGDQGDGTIGGQGGDICGGTPGAGGGGGNGGDDGGNGQNGPAGGGGGGGTSGLGGDGAGGFVSICWEEPIPDGYCVSDGGGCNKWWPCCGQYGYGGMQCFYYRNYYAPPAPCEACPSGTLPGVLYITLDNTLACNCDGETLRLIYNPTTFQWEWDGIGSANLYAMMGTHRVATISCSVTRPSGEVGIEFGSTSGVFSFPAQGGCDPALFIADNSTFYNSACTVFGQSVEFVITE